MVNCGRYRATGWSNPILPASTSCITAIVANSLLVDPIPYRVVDGSGIAPAASATPADPCQRLPCASVRIALIDVAPVASSVWVRAACASVIVSAYELPGALTGAAVPAGATVPAKASVMPTVTATSPMRPDRVVVRDDIPPPEFGNDTSTLGRTRRR
jgi:hypothetical protein